MKGFQITFFTQQGRRHGNMPLAEWLLRTARELGLRGATLTGASEGFGQHGRIHSVHFFELADQPQEVTVAATEDETARLFDRLKHEGVQVFYVKSAVEFGVLGGPPE